MAEANIALSDEANITLSDEEHITSDEANIILSDDETKKDQDLARSLYKIMDAVASTITCVVKGDL